MWKKCIFNQTIIPVIFSIKHIETHLATDVGGCLRISLSNETPNET